MRGIRLKDSWRKALLVAFVLFNTLMVIRANRMAAPVARSPVHEWMQRVLASHPRFLPNTLDWYLSWYPYLTGTDLTAVMFSTLSQREWLLWITAKYADGSQVDLPLPRQSPRTFLQRTFVDNKEAKFHNNIYGDEIGRIRYAHYLCREYPVHQGVVIQSIGFSIRWRDFLKREEALQRGYHAEGPFYDYFLNDFPCPTPESVPVPQARGRS